ncbi:MAG: NUDIX domain-containing protein [Solirubrobacterales bacterium]
MAAKRSAGILLFRRAGADDGGPLVLLVHPGGPFWQKKDLGAWSIPKGQIEEGEDPRACALRELAEELGAEAAPALAPEQLLGLGAIRQRGGKVVEAWAAEADFDPERLASNTFALEWPPRSGRKEEFPEVDRAEWFDLGEASSRILAAQSELLDRLAALLGGERPADDANAI